jgi:prepilin-type N-terminal cleavage/methylation domain-containing protein
MIGYRPDLRFDSLVLPLCNWHGSGTLLSIKWLAMAKMRNRRSGMTLMELMCCIAIISILAAMYLGVIGTVYKTIKRVLGAN